MFLKDKSNFPSSKKKITYRLSVDNLHLLLPSELERYVLLLDARLGIVQRHVPDEVALVSESASALGALVRLLSGLWRHVGRIVIEVLVTLEQLLLPEALVTLFASIRLLVGVDEHVRLEMAGRY